MKEIQLICGLMCKVDDEDFDHLSQYRWHHIVFGSKTYAFTDIGKKYHRMHRIILNAPKGKVVDHINGDGLDNRRCNIRICDIGDNTKNRGMLKNNKSGLKGVVLHKGRWIAQIGLNKKHMYLGSFDTKEEAHAEYARKVIELHGEFANTGD